MGLYISSPILTLFQSHGHDLKKSGGKFTTCCPFHDDSTPSLTIDPKQGLWHCFGCGVGGDGITFLEKSLGLSFGEAADKWRHLTGEEPKHSKTTKGGPPMNMKRRDSKLTPELEAEDLQLLNRLQDIYAQDLGTSKKALTYLEKRGLGEDSFEALRAFGIGYVTGSGLPQLSEDQKRRLQTLGILNDKGNETLYGCLVCPLYDENKNVVSFWARSCTNQTSGRVHRTLSGPRRGIIHREAAKGSKQVVLVEGFLDALACYEGGVRNVIPISGATNISTDLLKLLHAENVEEVLLCLDPDEAGDEGSKVWGEALERRGLVLVVCVSIMIQRSFSIVVAPL